MPKPKTRYPWRHKMTPEQRSRMLDRDYAAQEEVARREEESAQPEEIDIDEEDYGPLNRF
jgi:hypothetical protein